MYCEVCRYIVYTIYIYYLSGGIYVSCIMDPSLSCIRNTKLFQYQHRFRPDEYLWFILYVIINIKPPKIWDAKARVLLSYECFAYSTINILEQYIEKYWHLVQ